MSTKGGLDSYSPEYLAEDDSQSLIDASVAVIVVITIVYAMFLISRLFCAEHNHWEFRVLYPFSYLLCLGLCINGILFVKVAGAGRHLAYWLIHDPSVIVPFLKIQTAGEFIYMAGVTFPKVAILILYLRVFVERKVRIITWIVIGVVLANWVAVGIIAALVTCQPFAFKWDKTIPGGHCANLMAAYKYVSIPNILTDLAVAILPLSTLYHLQMSRTRKIGICLTFMAGSLGIITSVIRFVGFYESNLESDLWLLGVKTTIYTMIEPSAYFICSCLPGMSPLRSYLRWFGCQAPA
ncbi:hypothetical protein N8I77_013325 [Diaporthe amygdali]|uniref:Rhodopsin domain-containing protein n=1 Tax=Phomopsis amygdali TaxID=1214568 RepID=A0AAD9VY57_PHOAM|nr:hypothetical protein N8I77_013325 [Diaporthe amygdali]